jgi:hypothetical protein
MKQGSLETSPWPGDLKLHIQITRFPVFPFIEVETHIGNMLALPGGNFRNVSELQFCSVILSPDSWG